MKPYSLYAKITETVTTMYSTYMRSVAAELEAPTEPEPLTLPPTEPPVLKRTHTVRGPGDPTPDSNRLVESFLNFDEYKESKRGKVGH